MVEKSHGRIETRKIAVSDEIVPHLAWPALAQVARLERHRESRGESRGKKSVEIVYLATSLPPDKAGPDRLLTLIRDHWGIENRLHHVRDTAFDEDRCRVRAGARPLATLRNTAIALIRRAGIPIPEARENFREDRNEVINLVTRNLLWVMSENCWKFR